MKKILTIITILFLVLITGYGLRVFNMYPQKKVEQNNQADESDMVVRSPAVDAESKKVSQDEASNNKIKVTDQNNLVNKTIVLPENYILDNFPFESQAPFANWDEMHEEACEEASVILANYYFKKERIDASIMDKEINRLVDWQINKWGVHKNLNLQEISEMAKEVYGLKLKIKRNVKIEDIKQELSQKHSIIVPAAGQLLGNPFYKQPGPVYHVLVGIGYDDKNFITQDVGTKRGDHYKYNQKIFYNAIHDWPGESQNISVGEKSVLVTEDY